MLQYSNSIMTPKELSEKFFTFTTSYFLTDVRNDKAKFYALSEKDLQENPLCYAGIFLNLVIDGKLEEAWVLLEKIEKISTASPKIKLMYYGLFLVHPEISWNQFTNIIKILRKNNTPISNVALTCERPFLLNGLNDFTRIGPFLKRNKEQFIEYGKFLYGEECSHFIYRLCLAEYEYQLNNIIEAELLVSQTIKEFDKKSKSRLLFVALYLQSKILLSQGKIVESASYIKYIRSYIKTDGLEVFSKNIDAVEVFYALHNADYVKIQKWLSNSSPDEYGDFNMLDLYRYMIKIRCYIIANKSIAVVALAEKLRPLLERGKRHMDLCELDILLAISLYTSDKKKLALESFERALKYVRRYNYFRIIADEGDIMLHILLEYIKIKGQSPFLLKLLEITRTMAIRNPLYLKQKQINNETFSQTEIEILKLLEQGKNKQDISEYFLISINTVKYHMKKIYGKLNANAPHQAVWNAKQLGII